MDMQEHVVSGVGEGKQAQSCPECKETFEAPLNAYVTSRLASLALDITNGVHRQFYKSGGVPKSISYSQFFKAIFGSHWQAGTGIRRLVGVSARQPCINWCSRPAEELKEVFPKFSGDKQINVTKIVPLLEQRSTRVSKKSRSRQLYWVSESLGLENPQIAFSVSIHLKICSLEKSVSKKPKNRVWKKSPSLQFPLNSLKVY